MYSTSPGTVAEVTVYPAVGETPDVHTAPHSPRPPEQEPAPTAGRTTSLFLQAFLIFKKQVSVF